MTIELSNSNKIIYSGGEKLSTVEIKDIVKNYLGGDEFERLQKYDNYYESENVFISDKVRDKMYRDKTPNNYVPTAYYSTVVDTMSGYMFDNVQYIPRTIQDDNFAIALNEILEANSNSVKEMVNGVRGLAYNKGVELVYTTGDGETNFDIKFANIDPRQMIGIYTDDIEPELYCGIRVTTGSGDNLYKIDVIYASEWQYYNMNNKDEVTERQPAKTLYFKECPVVIYNTNDMGTVSPYNKIIPYINVLDYLLTGNANDIEGLTDAILVLTKLLKDSDIKHMDELSALMGVEPDERAEYLQKNSDPAFREYASKLLMQEIHKHSHVVDFYSPDSGLSGQVSGKALKIRLFDMDMSSKRIEKVYKLGGEKKVRLITGLMQSKGIEVGEVDIIYNRTLPSDFEDLAIVLKDITFLSDETKIELLSMDVEKEKLRLEEQSTANMERFNLNNPVDDIEDEEI